MGGFRPVAICVLLISTSAAHAQDKPALIRPIGDPIPVQYAASRLQFSPDGKTLCINTGGVLFLIDVATASIKAPGIQGPHSETGSDRPPGSPPVVAGAYAIAWDFAFSPDSKKLLVATTQTTQWWDVHKGGSLGRAAFFGRHYDPTIISGAGDVYLISRASESIGPGRSIAQPMVGGLWNASRGKRSGKPLPFELKIPPVEPHIRSFAQVAFSPDGKRLAVVHNHGKVRLFDCQKGKELVKDGLAPAEAEDGSATRVVWSPDGERLLVYTDKGAQLWETTTFTKVGERLATPETPGQSIDKRYRAAFNSTSTKLALSSFDANRADLFHNVQLIDVATGTKAGEFALGEKHEPRRIAHLQYVGESLLVMLTDDITNQKRPWLWNPTAGRGVAEPPEVVRVHLTAVSSDGRYVATCGADAKEGSKKVVRLWQLP